MTEHPDVTAEKLIEDIIGKSRNVYYRWERGHPISEDSVDRVAKTFGKRRGEILEGKDISDLSDYAEWEDYPVGKILTVTKALASYEEQHSLAFSPEERVRLIRLILWQTPEERTEERILAVLAGTGPKPV